MRLGLVARADNSGLGMQTFEFYRHMKPAKTMVVDISKYNNNPQYPERYPDGMFVRGFPTPNDIDSFLRDLDVVFIAEAAYNPYLYEKARELGVKTAVQYNYEFFDWFNPAMPKPDMLIAPSQWHFTGVQNWCNQMGVKHTYLHCPVARDKLPFRTINKAKIFLHTAGKSAAFDRNGTKTVIEASLYLKSEALILVHFQGEQGLAHQATNSIADYARHLELNGSPNRVTIIQKEFDNYADVYSQGDVLLLPRRYGGNCLPMNEALSVGMPVIMTDISPNKDFLPQDWLIPAEKMGEFTPRTVVDIYGATPRDLAAKIDELCDIDLTLYNNQADSLSDTISWDAMKVKYKTVLEALCTQF